MTTAYQIAPQAKIPYEGLTAAELSLLLALFDRKGIEAATRTASGHYVSRLGQAKKVLWARPAGAPLPTILTIVDQS
jgi:hypothetical protein